MTVKELIEKLQKFDPELTVYRSDAGWGNETIYGVRLEPQALKHTTWGEDFRIEHGLNTMTGEPVEVKIPIQKYIVTGYTPGVVIE